MCSSECNSVVYKLSERNPQHVDTRCGRDICCLGQQIIAHFLSTGPRFIIWCSELIHREPLSIRKDDIRSGSFLVISLTGCIVSTRCCLDRHRIRSYLGSGPLSRKCLIGWFIAPHTCLPTLLQYPLLLLNSLLQGYAPKIACAWWIIESTKLCITFCACS